ncbi:hypothetical protein [Streptomyces phage phiSAJS1]|uniref:hypothetical protein n=1 Tax=Streptomyces phage phiSAJS1 TaxID=1755682 RepID=UPI000E303775|nr:hypothetical protein AVT91_p28 [Streptomyces phage phiSAJS1]AXP07819.1 hypothetical protein [Streptomyces phage phiSAJS1]
MTGVADSVAPYTQLTFPAASDRNALLAATAPTPRGPWGPIAPVAPAGPAGPAGPVAPVGSGVPAAPAGPGTDVLRRVVLRACRAVSRRTLPSALPGSFRVALLRRAIS